MSGTIPSWLTLATSPIDASSRITMQAKMFIQEFGDGHIARIPDGINNAPRDYRLVYRNISPSEHASLLGFVLPLLRTGNPVRVPALAEDPSGNTNPIFYVQNVDFGGNEGGALWDWTITLREVFV